MKISPTPVTAAIAGLFSGLVMPPLWSRFGDSGAGSMGLVVAFLFVVALPAHAFVLGFGRSPETGTDTALLKRVIAWLVATAAAVAGAEVSGLRDSL